MTFSVSVDNQAVLAQLETLGQSKTRLRRVVSRESLSLQTAVQANSSGRPGPNAPTGNYRRSWNTRITETPTGVVGTVGTTSPQGRRLEFGFSGLDSLGRNYNQPAFPHVAPAIAEREDIIVRSIEQAILGEGI